ncbi:MAG: A/G-specific adenine glycosylase [Rhodospirillales bacterium]
MIDVLGPLDSAGLQSALLLWYDRERRDLPWRAAPGVRPDPYRVWLSEIMLQQTTTTAAGPYFERFLARFPDVQTLAAAEQESVLTLWAGLGYYARARNLHACAQRLVADFDGRFPEDEASLLTLPGIGPYTAAAIAAIAFDRPAAPLDGNWERVVARLFDEATPLPQAKPRLKALAERLVPQRRPGDFAQAMMDLGAGVCVPEKPRCLLCPLAGFCAARAAGTAEGLPRKAPKPIRPERYGIAFWAVDGRGRVLLRQRPQKGLLGGMIEVPGTPWRDAPWDEAEALAHVPGAAAWDALPGQVTHVFTHFRLTLQVWRAEPTAVRAAWGEAPAARWVARDRLGDEALPSLMRKVVRLAAKASLSR